MKEDDNYMGVLQYPVWNKKYFLGFPEIMDALYDKSLNYYHKRLEEGILYRQEDKDMDEEMIYTFFPSFLEAGPSCPPALASHPTVLCPLYKLRIHIP